MSTEIENIEQSTKEDLYRLSKLREAQYHLRSDEDAVEINILNEMGYDLKKRIINKWQERNEMIKKQKARERREEKILYGGEL